MVNNQRYRWDFIGLSTDTKPTKATSNKVTNGSTYYESNTSKLYVWYDDQWYERKPLGGGGGGGTTDFEELSNRPKYNGAVMTGSTDIPEVETYSDFVGTDGTTAGTAGLVPAPAATDADKFLKSDGTWSDAGGGGEFSKEITQADINWPANNPTDVAVWLLEPGVYHYRGENQFSLLFDSSRTVTSESDAIVFPILDSGTNLRVPIIYRTTDADEWIFDLVYKTGSVPGYSGLYRKFIFGDGIRNNLTTTSATYALDARQGKVLKDLIDNLDARVTALEG